MNTQTDAPVGPEADCDGFVVDGNWLALFTAGEERLRALLDLIGAAQRELRLLYYIFADDAAGRQVRDAAVAAAERGVQVSLLVDGFGSEDSDETFFEPIKAAGGCVCRFLPRFGRRYLLRNHQKMAVADDRLALVGGFNVEQAYFDDGEQGWRDLGLLVDGPAAAHLTKYFDALLRWAQRPRARMRHVNRLIKAASQDEGRLRWLFGGPTKRLSPWALALKHDVDRGRSVDVIAAYFAPNPGTLRRLGRAARRGATRIVTAAKSDNSMTVAAARHTYPRLLRHRARVFEYQPSPLHTKLYVVDDVVYLGSANCDMRSLFLNLEVMLRVEDAAFARAMRGYVDGELERCREVRPELLRARAGPWRRLVWSAAYFLVAVVDYSVTRRLNFRPGAGIAT